MGRVTDPTGRVQVFQPSSVQAGDPHTASMDLDFSEKTLRLWYESQNKHRAWAYTYPTDAPFVEIADVDTAYEFKMTTPSSTDNVAWPWVIGPDVDTIHVSAIVAIPEGVGYSSVTLQAYTQTLKDAVDTTTGPEAPLQTPPAPVFSGPWRTNNNQPLQVSSGSCLVLDPDIADNSGVVCLGLKLYWRPMHVPTADQTATPVAKLVRAWAYNYKRGPL